MAHAFNVDPHLSPCFARFIQKSKRGSLTINDKRGDKFRFYRIKIIYSSNSIV
ncbi:Hypothetical protein SCC1_4464 (plasmid) [Pectobacterium versatile]|nr:Hypothetical protein SCC1_4464 [Pectobacterium versatile]